MKIYSWNVNGLRACAKKGFGTFLADCGADIVEMVVRLYDQWCAPYGQTYKAVGVHNWTWSTQPYSCPYTIQRGGSSPNCGCR